MTSWPLVPLLLPVLAALPPARPTSPQAPVAAALPGPVWHTTNPTFIPGRVGAAAVLLRSGNVLLIGGSRNFPSEVVIHVELYDPATDTWNFTGSTLRPMNSPSATLLPSGKVLLVGSGGHELYDPATGLWSDPPSDFQPQEVQGTLTLLPSGKVLAANAPIEGDPAGAQLYDPATGTWTSVGPLTQRRYSHTATLLPSGKVLLAGGIWQLNAQASAEVYDPATGTWTAVSPMAQARIGHTATLLASGKVLVVGGTNDQGTRLDTAEMYDPASNSWTPTGRLAWFRTGHTAVRLPSGKVLVVGGFSDETSTSPVPELYDPATGAWTPEESTATGLWGGHTMTLLPWGSVLIAGGFVTRAAELYLREASGHPPAALGKQAWTDEDSPVAITLGGLDLFGDALSFAVATQPAHGTLSGTAPELLYTPEPDFNGTDTFTYRSHDGALDSEPATVILIIAPVQDPPKALPLALTTLQGEPLKLRLEGTDPDGDALKYRLEQLPAHGEVLGTPPELTFVPHAGYGRDSFTYRVSDGVSESEPATVSIAVTPRQVGCSSTELGAASGLALLALGLLARTRFRTGTSAPSASNHPRA